MYGRPCKASDYGFSRISEVIDAVCNVAEVRGKGAEKIVVLVDGDDITLHGREGNLIFVAFSSAFAFLLLITGYY